jgi:translation elongation factor EF-4
MKVYAGIFPIDSNDFLKLEESIKRVYQLLLGPIDTNALL